MSQLNSLATPTLITKDAVINENPWTLLADDEAIGVSPTLVLGFERALSHLEGLNGRYGVRVNPSDDVRLLSPYLHKIALIEIAFPGYRDGRGYSSARILRQDMGYLGPVRAVGDVLRDQLFFMIRCGFSEFVLKDKDPKGAVAHAKSLFDMAYQGAADGLKPVWALRSAKQEKQEA
jgi:uncharacterized protein (DUF934 family)